MDNNYDKSLHRSTQRAWFITAEWGIKLLGGVSLWLIHTKKATDLLVSEFNDIICRN